MDYKKDITLYCDLNEIAHKNAFIAFADFCVVHKDFQNVSFFNTTAHLTEAIWEYMQGTIDQEAFFRVGDVESGKELKPTRPFLMACEHILTQGTKQILYVISKKAKEYYEYSHSREIFLNELHKIQSEVFVIED